MPFSISGRIAEGMDDALAQVLDRRLKEATRQQIERQNQAENLMRQQGLELQKQGLEQSAANQGLAQKRFDLEDLRYRDKQTEEATNRNRASDMAGVLAMGGGGPNMPGGGMTPEAQMREISGLALKSGADPLKVIANLQPKVVPKKYTPPQRLASGEIAQFEEGQIPAGTRFYQEPHQGPAPDYEWVMGADGKPRQIRKGTAQPGDAPITASTNYQTEVRDETNKKALASMRSYGDDMLDVIDSLVDAKGNLKKDVAGVVGTWQGRVPAEILGEESQNALENLGRLQKMLDISQLRELKAQSRTGATGFGALSAPELAIIEGAASKLGNRRQSEAVYADELKRIRDKILEQRRGYPEGNGGGSPPATPSATDPGRKYYDANGNEIKKK